MKSMNVETIRVYTKIKSSGSGDIVSASQTASRITKAYNRCVEGLRLRAAEKAKGMRVIEVYWEDKLVIRKGELHYCVALSFRTVAALALVK